MGHSLDLEEYAQIARQAAAESCVLLKNEKEALPLRKGDKVAVFGRCALHYYKSGLGSGGLVNTRYVVSILDALKACESISLEESLLRIYEEWSVENPVDKGRGWGTIPWSQKEMPVTDEMVEASKAANVAIVIIGRTAGEDQDNKNEEGSYLLTGVERDMLAKVCKAFLRTIVLLNVGNIIDMKWVEEYQPAAVMYVWQGGQEGGNGVVDVLTGKVNPCGKLADTIACDIDDYPSTKNFGDKYKNYYQEDIYVGYRYFETFAKEKVQYPFGFGLSYTQFTIQAELDAIVGGNAQECCRAVDNDKTTSSGSVQVRVKVTNTGSVSGKEVAQVYIQAPQGLLGKPARVLAGFYKTGVIQPGESEEFVIDCPKSYFASYDDAGVTGHKSCMLLEAGEYRIFVGANVRSATCCGSWMQETEVLEQLEEACAPVEEFERLKLVELSDGSFCTKMETVPLRTVNVEERIEAARKEALPYTGDEGYLLGDVFDKKVSLDAFVAQLSQEDLICMFRGEGMCSPKVTPGTAGAFGGITDNLRKFGIPVICCADGPSGIRMDCGAKAFSVPNGTALGCSFNPELNKRLFEQMGKELQVNKVDTLLGPGINIHRNPLNGRNFEYISEDPLLTGKMCAQQLQGMHQYGVTGTIKHYAANNQEKDRTTVEAAVSERALREIYLKGYEIAVKEGNARSIMTTYGPINGIWTAGNYDLCTTILRKQWGYTGIVMTDWWAAANWEGEAADKPNRAPMIRAQNDVYMCCASSEEDMHFDNVKEKLLSGEITCYDLQRNAKNILNFIMESPAMLRELGRVEEEATGEPEEGKDGSGNIPFYDMDAKTNEFVLSKAAIPLSDGEIHFGLTIPTNGQYYIWLKVKSELSELAQLPVSLYVNNFYRNTYSYNGTGGVVVEKNIDLGLVIAGHFFIKLVLPETGLEIESITITSEESVL